MADPRHRIEHALAEDFLRALPDESVDLIVTDPPYFRVKDAPWDRAWDKVEGFVAWIGELAEQWRRVLRPNGTLYVFASSKMAARVEVEIGRRFEVIASAVWVKPCPFSTVNRGPAMSGRTSKSDLRAFFPNTERIIVAEHFGADSTALGESGYAAKCDELRGFVFEPLRAYLDGERERAGFTPRQVNDGLGNQMAGHYFTRSQWALPTEANYAALRSLLGPGYLARDYGDLRAEFETLREEFETLREEFEHLRRPFDATQGAHHTDVWTYPTVQSYPGKHPCEKPAAMAEDIVRVSSRPGAVVLDTFCGSGAFLAAAARLGRVAWGCDADDRWARHTAAVVGTEAVSTGDVPEIRSAHESRRTKPAEAPLPLFAALEAS